MKSKELTPLEALERLCDYHNLPSKNPVAYLLEQENLPSYRKTIEKELKALEIIKEELGIDLITLFKALKYGIYFRGQKEEEPKDVQLRMFYEEPMLVHYNEYGTEEVYVSGYGLSWDLVRMECDEIH